MMKLELHTTLTLTHREPERVVCSLMTFVPLALRWTRALDMMTRHKCTRCGRGQRHEAHSKGHPPSSGTHFDLRMSGRGEPSTDRVRPRTYVMVIQID
jgi:hypothetical protein